MPARIGLIVAAFGLMFGAAFAPSDANAQTAAALNKKGDTLYIIGQSRRGAQVTGKVKLKLKDNDPFVAIDVRPADGLLYGVTKLNKRLYRINVANGRIALIAAIPSLPLNGYLSMDFNPTVDAIRFVSDKGFNGRFSFVSQTFTTDIKLSYSDREGAPRIVAAAYTNSFPGAGSTNLIDLDAELDAVFEQVPPNSGTLTFLSRFRPRIEAPIAFDIAYQDDNNVGLAIYERQLYVLPLEASPGPVAGPKIRGLSEDVRDLAVLPPPQ